MSRVVVYGAAGTVGSLACDMVDRHPDLELAAALSREHAGESVRSVHPRRRSSKLYERPSDVDLSGVDAAIVCLSAEPAVGAVVDGLRAGVEHVVDVSPAFRLIDDDAHRAAYPEADRPPGFRGSHSVAAGVPELFRADVRDCRVVSVPGCYVTGALLALAPLARRGFVRNAVVDAKEGASGAGSSGPRFTALAEDCRAYGVPRHRHGAELEQWLGFPHTFVPHLLPLDQGMLVSAYVRLRRDEPPSDAEILNAFYCEYSSEPFVHGVLRPPGVRDVRDTNEAHVHFARTDERGVVVFLALDNLWKGAAGQAVQCLNVRHGLDEAAGLS